MKHLVRASVWVLLVGSAITLTSGVASAATAAPPTLNFTNVGLNTTSTQNVTITVDAGFRVAFATGSGLNAPFAFKMNTCGAGGGFAGPGTCNVKESFTPTSTATANASTTVDECPIAGGSCVAINFTEQGTGISKAKAAPPSLSFGNVAVNTSVTKNVKITVDTGYTVEIGTGSGLNPPFSFAFDTCSNFPGPGTCTVKDTFSPTAAGVASATINADECPDAGGACIPISDFEQGTGVLKAKAVPSSLNFGNVALNTSVTKNVTLTVDTGYTVEIGTGSGLNPPFSFSFDTCSSFPGPGTCTVKDTFTPTALGAASATINADECPDAGGACIPISDFEQGVGVSKAKASKTALDFGNVPVGRSVTQSVTITVDTGYRTDIATGGGLNPPFSFNFDTCGASGGFAGPGTCVVKESFRPTGAGPASATTFVDECPIAGGSCIPISFTEQGSGTS